MNIIQRAISDIAEDRWNRGIRVTYSELREELNSKGLRAGKNNRGLGRQIKTAYDRAIQENNQDKANCIANCYTKDNGEYAWEKKN